MIYEKKLEDKKLEDKKLEDKKFTYVIQNVVGTVKTDLEENMDLLHIAKMYPDVEYNPEKFPGLVMRNREPKATTLVFSNGKMVITGMKHSDEAKLVASKVIGRVSKIGIKISNPVITIQNIVASGDINCSIDLNLASVVMENAMYEPEVFPGLIYRMKDPKTVFLLFSTGKIVCTGAKNKEMVAKACSNVYSDVREYGVAIEPGQEQIYEDEEDFGGVFL
ncbi:MAG: TATA-box-binding protein [Promethearchaeota archaeon]